MSIRSFAIALLTLAAACACSTPAPPAPPTGPSSGSTAAALTCTGAITTAPLPTWARAGFSPPDQPAPQVHGIDGSILGVVFGAPLRAPNVPGHGNKILWVASPLQGSAPSPSAPNLRIHATLNGSDVAVDHMISGGPGPSLVDMPRPGCWTFTLSWSGRTDRLAVPYQ